MVYRSFALEADQDAVGAELEGYEPNLNRARTFHLARNAMEHGLSAIPCRLRNPWDFLKSRMENRFSGLENLRMILNHRIRADSPLGHYTLFIRANIENETVCIHDPEVGPERILSKTELSNLWTPFGEHCEITGNVAVIISQSKEYDGICKKCGGHFSMKAFETITGTALKTVFCPWCDAVVFRHN